MKVISMRKKYSFNFGVHAAWMLLSWLSFSQAALASDQIPGGPQENPIAIVGATLHPIVGDVIEDGAILFDKGKIVALGAEIDIPNDAQVIDAEGKHVYPSLIEAYSDIGLVEINSVPETTDSREIGQFNPNVRAATAVNPDSELIPVNRANGILLAVSAPEGSLIGGLSALLMLDGWTWEDMTLEPDVGMHVRWSSREETIEELAKIFDQAKRYQAGRELGTQPVDLRLQALGLVLDGSVPLIADANSLEQIRSAVAFANRYGLKLIIHGGSDAAHCADLLKEQRVPVILSGVYRSPRRRHAAYDGPYSLPAKLQELGVQYCISAGGRFGASGVRNLPYHAATAAAYGLDEDAALASITTAPAEILGVADRVGSLQPGLDATLFIADGNILETPTHVEMAFIQGRQVDLDNKHEQLYRKYSAKYERQSNSDSQ
jgi:imidazolonepropionase-like amidohydrolase